ncbi:MAG: GNAT family N-acetyltransferase [Maribacter sp.]
MENGYFISTDKDLLNIYAIQKCLATLYWAKGRTVADVEKTIRNSYCFGIYSSKNEQIGFARLVTDYIYFGYLMDIIIFEKFQGNGYGKVLVEHMLNDAMIKNLKTLTLKTKDAHNLYKRYGFENIGDSLLWMSLDKQQLE